MDPLTIIDLIISLAGMAANAFGKAGLSNLAAAAQAAVDQLAAIKSDPVTQAEIEQFKLNPKW